ncbi:tRNA (uridine(34)/cytosine(34)/5-carboxymethylaminomethyluridine(34)-2'-O)-methyltransferase TrmL [Irregularibacter muris]|uniref:Putative tRNA (cytidine(34)-2'-O)-methyltransferase n=1 Tax=Irregularibacter muris TaxID=1796619 RepID=A0AAE3HFF9_9FIRM|nr:tRNA (uridine(34)/cytosine(34)/5-carboxymethylaminomethyluridine(34)-2'-O)-methyltransferase TrmL [Irregularibacter muris]MCR1897608.1 tRNA (uridine(34)/cytosine(34)/5-carboxymethylaminomethyluridine(34)-2'-O)-methyltransferase TrmL [Irregularibacter muris]
MSINIVLVEPEIPQNTGNIARTCGAIHGKLHLVKPLGFSLESKYLKRAGLDYWDLLDIEYHDNLEEFFKKYPDSTYYYATTKGGNDYAHMSYQEDCFILFGKETAGLPKELLEKNPERAIRIPMRKEARSLNLSNSVAIIAYEALRQLGFKGMD